MYSCFCCCLVLAKVESYDDLPLHGHDDLSQAVVAVEVVSCGDDAVAEDTYPWQVVALETCNGKLIGLVEDSHRFEL